MSTARGGTARRLIWVKRSRTGRLPHCNAAPPPAHRSTLHSARAGNPRAGLLRGAGVGCRAPRAWQAAAARRRGGLAERRVASRRGVAACCRTRRMLQVVLVQNRMKWVRGRWLADRWGLACAGQRWLGRLWLTETPSGHLSQGVRTPARSSWSTALELASAEHPSVLGFSVPHTAVRQRLPRVSV